MKKIAQLALGALMTAGVAAGTTVATTAPASAGVHVGIGIGIPGPGYYGPGYAYGPGYYPRGPATITTTLTAAIAAIRHGAAPCGSAAPGTTARTIIAIGADAITSGGTAAGAVIAAVGVAPTGTIKPPDRLRV